MNVSRLLSFTLLVSLIFSISCVNQENKETSLSEADKQALLQRIDLFNQTFAEGDAKALASMITRTYTHTNGNSASIDGATWLDYLQKRQEQIESGEWVVHRYSLEEQEIVYHPACAILTGKVSVSQSRAGVKEDRSFRITNVWVQEDGLWKRAGFHDGRIE